LNTEYSSNEARQGPYWYVYQCRPTNEARGGAYRNPRACGAWCLLRRRDPIPDDLPGHRRVQAKCGKCGNRPRLHPGIVIGPFDDDWEAMKVRAEKAREEVVA